MAVSNKQKLRLALLDLLNHYVSLVQSGDAGNWDPFEEDVVIAALNALGDDSKVIAKQDAS